MARTSVLPSGKTLAQGGFTPPEQVQPKEKECGAFLLNCINWVLDKNKSLRLSEFGGAKF